MKVEILQPHGRGDEISLTFVGSGTENYERAGKIQKIMEQTVLEIVKEIPQELNIGLFLQVGAGPFSLVRAMSVISGKVDYCAAWA